ncbi:C40 family peptidase [Ferruginibacter sp.]
MQYAVCSVPVAPIRKEPDHRTEMSSQLLFGECCEVINTTVKGWLQVTCKADGYEGWCQKGQLKLVDEEAYNNETVLAADWVNTVEYNAAPMFVPLGSLVSLNNTTAIFKGKHWQPATAKRDAATIKDIAFRFLNTAYLWGGRSVFGIDCSGFAQAVYKFLNVPLLRDAHMQATQGEPVGFLQEARCGDLAFFDDAAGEIVHVGILLNDKEIIHASVKVRIDKIDSAGIINTDTGERTHQLRIIKRYF